MPCRAKSEARAGVHNIFGNAKKADKSKPALGCWLLLEVIGLFLDESLTAQDKTSIFGVGVGYCVVIKRILVRCPTTKKLNVTGVVVEEDVFAATKVKSGTVACSHCGEKHAWNKKQAILAR